MRPLFTAYNDLTLLETGVQYFPALIEAINKARKEIYFETYIFALDRIGNKLKDAFKDAVSRGVSVHVILDWIGTGEDDSKKVSRELKEIGVEVHVFNRWFLRGTTRTHRKIAVIDEDQAFVGGINVNDDFLSDRRPWIKLSAPRWDFAVRIKGPLVAHVYYEAKREWNRTSKFMESIQFFETPPFVVTRVHKRPGVAAFVVRDNIHNRRAIQNAYQRALGSARKSVLIANPYFAPGKKFCEALARATQRGVEVKLLLGAGEVIFQDWVAQSFYMRLLKAGVRVFEYRKTQLHAKVASIDDRWATVGSSNVDALSLLINHEANVIIRDERIAKELREKIEMAIADAVEIRKESFANRSWIRRAVYWIAYKLYRGVMRIATFGRFS